MTKDTSPYVTLTDSEHKSLLRKALIVDTMIEELDDLRFERDDAKQRLADELGKAEENRHYTGVWAERLVSLTDDVIELETWLSIGLEKDD